MAPLSQLALLICSALFCRMDTRLAIHMSDNWFYRLTGLARGKYWLSTADDEMLKDARAPVIYLRSFAFELGEYSARRVFGNWFAQFFHPLLSLNLYQRYTTGCTTRNNECSGKRGSGVVNGGIGFSIGSPPSRRASSLPA